MEDNLQLFDFEGNQVRTLKTNGEPWFVGKDVAEILGYKNGSRDINAHVDEEDRLKYQISTAGQMREQILVNESGLYSLILSSKMPNVKRFKHWVTSEVLPSIRKTGKYEAQPKYKIPQSFAEALQLAADQAKELDLTRPKANYFDLQMKNPGLLTTTVIAKEHGMTAHKLNMFLNKHRIIFKRGKTWMPYKEYENQGFCDYEHWSNQENKDVAPLLKWTQKGEKLIHDLLEQCGIESQAKKFNYSDMEINV